MKKNTIKYFFDYTCPFSYIGFNYIKKLQNLFEITIEYIPINVHPNIPPDGLLLNEIFTNYRDKIEPIYEYAKSLGNKNNISINYFKKKYNSDKAILYGLFASEYQKFETYADLVFKTTFETNKNIYKDLVIKNIYFSLNLDFQQASALIDKEYYSDLRLKHKYLTSYYKISSVPSFVINNNIIIIGIHDFCEMTRYFSV